VSFHTFIQERVDAAVVEVGVGGEYDSTNIVSRPVVCGITSLGLDHVAVLGDTIDKIAWHKAGIMKRNCPVYSSPQPPDAIFVIESRAAEKGAPCKMLTTVNIDRLENIDLGLKGAHQKINAALAKEVCNEWIRRRQEDGFEILGNEISALNGLQKAKWPGRCQHLTAIKYPSIDWYLDGAHTAESLRVCGEWFKNIIEHENNDRQNAIIFNCTHGRQGEALIPPLLKAIGSNFQFSKIILSSNEPFETSENKIGDITDSSIQQDSSLKLQKDLANTFREEAEKLNFIFGQINVAGSVAEACNMIDENERVLITGSLYLVGSALAVFDYKF
jgi:folylpolyglutamate synthase